MSTSALSWPLVALFGMILAGASFLGYEHVLTGSVVAGIYGAVVSGGAVGHFATKGSG